MLDQSPEVEDKHLDNVVLILSHMYNFKVNCILQSFLLGVWVSIQF